MLKPKFNCFLVTDKEKMTFEEFEKYFKRKVVMNGYNYQKETFNELLLDLYNCNASYYAKWLESFKNVEYSFVKTNIAFVEELIQYEEEDTQNFDEMFEMYCKKSSIIARYISNIKKMASDPKNSKELISETLDDLIKKLDEIIENEKKLVSVNCEFVDKIRNEYKQTFNKIENGVLKEFFDRNYASIPEDIKEEVLSIVRVIKTNANGDRDNYFLSHHVGGQSRINMQSFNAKESIYMKKMK